MSSFNPESASRIAFIGSLASAPVVLYPAVPLLWKSWALLGEDRTQQDMLESIRYVNEAAESFPLIAVWAAWLAVSATAYLVTSRPHK